MPYSDNSFNPIDYLSYTSIYIETYFNDTLITKASGFFYNKQDRYYLVTNYHVLSGRNHIADSNGVHQPLHNRGAIPNKVKTYIYGWSSGNNGEISTDEGIVCEFTLIDKDENPLYKANKYTCSEYMDIAILPVNVTLNSFWKSKKLLCVNDAYYKKFESKNIIHPSDDVFILGYPFGKRDDSGTSIWKRGSIASNLANRLKFYVDTSTRSGMSGSPVFYINKDDTAWLKYGGKDIFEEKLYSIEFIGVYSGRVINEQSTDKDSYIAIKESDVDVAAQLGIVWKNYLIDEIIETN